MFTNVDLTFSGELFKAYYYANEVITNTYF